MSKIIKRRKLESMPFDKVFMIDGLDQSCHPTGDEVLFDWDDTWWDEYMDSEGEYHYGR